MAHVTCWIALDDATEDNGCLQVAAAHWLHRVLRGVCKVHHVT